MTYGELRRRLEQFRDKLIEHRELYARSVNDIIPNRPIRNGRELESQQRELHRLLAPLDPFLTQMSPGRIVVHRASGNAWDIFQTAAGNLPAIVKGDAMNDSILQLEGMIAIAEAHPTDENVTQPDRKQEGPKVARANQSISISGGNVNFGDKGTINVNVTIADVLKTAIAEVEKSEHDPTQLKTFRDRVSALLNHPLGKVLSQIGIGEVLKHL